MRNLFLYGDVGTNFTENIREFLKVCVTEEPVALLMMNEESKKYEDLYGIPIAQNSRKYKAIYPNNGKLSREDLETIYKSSGILVAGGYPRIYSNLYVSGKVGELIKRKYYNGVPYAGVSAGAILTGNSYEETSKTANIGDNQIYLSSKFNPKVVDNLDSKEQVQGFGFLENILLEPHFSEWGLFPALVNKLKSNKTANIGIGFDETIGVKVINESIFEFFGKGRGYVLSKKDENFLLSVKEPSQRYVYNNLKIKEVFER